MSVYSFSLLTNRKFLIDITLPCNFSHLLVPNEIDWSFPIETSFAKSKLNMTRVYLDCFYKVKLGIECLRDYDESNLNEKTTIDLFSFKINKDWLDYFSKNKYFQKRILELDGEEKVNTVNDFKLALLFNKWYKKLFKLSPSLLTKYEMIKRKNGLVNKNNQKVCNLFIFFISKFIKK